MTTMQADVSAVSVTLEVPPLSPVPSAVPSVPPAPSAPSHSGPLPFTGAQIELLILIAIGLVIAGLLIVAILRIRLEPSHA